MKSVAAAAAARTRIVHGRCRSMTRCLRRFDKQLVKIQLDNRSPFNKMVRAWYMDESEADQRLEHQLNPPQFVSVDRLSELGVKHWTFDPSSYQNNPEYEKLKNDRGYSYQDMIECSPDKLDNYEQKLKSFYDEHIHTDEEIRFVLGGSGYFDVRDPEDKWIRIEMGPGDMIVLPAGIYHRFTLDSKNYIKALRLFVGEPVWTPYPRSTLEENHPSVRCYREMFASKIAAN